MTKFIKVNGINLVPVVQGQTLKPSNDWVFYFDGRTPLRPVERYEVERVGVAFINPDHIYEVTAENTPGVGLVTHIYDAQGDYTTVAESLEEVMSQIEGKR